MDEGELGKFYLQQFYNFCVEITEVIQSVLNNEMRKLDLDVCICVSNYAPQSH